MRIILADTLYRGPLEELLRLEAPDAEFTYIAQSGEARGDLAGAEIFLAWGLEAGVIETVVKAAPDLRWFHLLSAGVESLMFPALRDSQIVITNARGIYAIPIAESVLAVMLLVAKRLLDNYANAQKRHWERLPRQELHGQTAGILGLGEVGSQVARRLGVMGMHVIACKRRTQIVPGVPIERLYGPHELNEFLDRCDWLIVTAALTPETRGMLGRRELHRMKLSAVLVNVARGEIIDEAELLSALDESRIAGACLDAFTIEPLPPDSRFWSHPRVFVTPHNSSSSPNTVRRNLELVRVNLHHYLKGERLINIVDKEAGY